MQTNDYAQWFRGSTPYISAHRGKTFVVLLGGGALEHPNLTNIVHDLALLHVLGVRLVLVHGARQQLDNVLTDSSFNKDQRITDLDGMTTVTSVIGQIKTKLEALFSTGLPNTPLHGVDIPVVSGNYITARPIGIVDGVDHHFTGKVRRIDAQRITNSLDTGALVLQSPIGYSPSGQAFNLNAAELACEIATHLHADKLIVFDELAHISLDNERVSTLTPTELERQLDEYSATSQASLHALARAVRAGIAKGHLVSFLDDGALLEELFTASGVGTQILEQEHKPIRRAELDDVAAIVEVIRPLEESGQLVRRSRDRLEQEIDHFLVAELDDVVVGCCAVYPFGDQAELACIAVHENYRRHDNSPAPGVPGIGDSLLAAAEQAALTTDAQRLFVLTTQTRDWFLERGFSDGSIDGLPDQKQSLYNLQRNSKVLTKALAP
jgi:amino-acid N-acetyltransferase